MNEEVAELETLYDTLAPDVFAYLRRRMEDAHAAEDLLQQTFLIAARNTAALQAANSKRAWLIGIARNLLREHRRRRTRQRTIPIPEDVAAPEASDEDPHLDEMRRAIAQLPETHREVLTLRLGDDLSYAEIAEALAIPIGTVRSRIHHAVRRLRADAAKHDEVNNT